VDSKKFTNFIKFLDDREIVAAISDLTEQAMKEKEEK
jgi:hypothetical protein